MNNHSDDQPPSYEEVISTENVKNVKVEYTTPTNDLLALNHDKNIEKNIIIEDNSSQTQPNLDSPTKNIVSCKSIPKDHNECDDNTKNFDKLSLSTTTQRVYLSNISVHQDSVIPNILENSSCSKQQEKLNQLNQSSIVELQESILKSCRENVTASASTMDSSNPERPTIVPIKPFNIKSDTQIVTEALKTKSEYILLKVLCNRTSDQRLLIAKYYQMLNGISLIREIKIQFNARFCIIMGGLSIPYFEFMARSIHNCSYFQWLYYILFTIPHNEIEDMKRYFNNKYKEPAENFIGKALRRDENSDKRHLIKPISHMLNDIRDETDEINEHEVENDIKQLNQMVGSLFFGGNKNEKQLIMDIFYKKNFKHIKLVCDGYAKLNDETKTIHNLLNRISPTNSIYKHIADFAINKSFYFAKILKKGFQGFSHDDYMLMHIFVRRAEIDLFDIKMSYEETHEKSLQLAIKDKTSGNYKRALIELLGEGKHEF